MITQDRAHSIDRAISEAERVGKVLTKELVAELDLTIEAAFRDAQEKVPVDSRSLKNSGRSGADVRDGGETWIGYMAWGGESVPKPIVDYSVYTLALGGERDWLRDSALYDAAIEAVIDSHVRRHLR